MNAAFAEDVQDGLSSSPKYLSSKYFYDKKGDRLFQQIMDMEEYYLTDCEFEILDKDKENLLEICRCHRENFNLIELGAGDGAKTKLLLKHFIDRQADFTYIPVDISKNIIDYLVGKLMEEIPQLKVLGIAREYFEFLDELRYEAAKKVILFLGSNIGNFPEAEAIGFLKRIADDMHSEDLLMVGFDLKKDPVTILNAYNDSKGITAEFNLNLLSRINRELRGDFDLDQFYHYPMYDPMTGQAKSCLVSKTEQIVKIDAIDSSFEFNAGEPIYMEVSQKYDIDGIRRLADKTGLHVEKFFFDSRNYFTDAILRKR